MKETLISNQNKVISNIMKDELITSETAELAKKAGFKEKTWDYFYLSEDKGITHDCAPTKYPYNDDSYDFGVTKYIARPSQSLLSRWIRENHNIVCSVYSNASGYIWEIHYDKTRGGTHIKDSDMRGDCPMSGTFTTYELAMEDCLSVTLRGLKYGKF